MVLMRHPHVWILTDDMYEHLVYGEFESDEQLLLFKSHELYQKSIDIVRPLRQMRIAADFDS